MTPTATAQDTDIKTLWANFTPDQRATIEEISAWQTAAGLSNAEFVSGCTQMSEQSWYQISTGRYGAKDPTRMVNIAKAHAARRRATFARANSLGARPLPFIETAKWQEMSEAVDSALAAAELGDDDKIIWGIGESGMGKTEIARQLIRTKTATMVTASEAWRDGYLDALTDIAEALGIPSPTNASGQAKSWASKGTAERAILKALTAKPRVLCVNEVEFFSRRLLNLIRKIADETKTVLVIFCVPEFYRDILTQGGAYARQLRTRTEGVVWLDKVESGDVAKVMEHYWPGHSHGEAAKAIARYACKFGGWRIIKRITRHLRGQFPEPDAAPALADVQAAISRQEDNQEAA